jgi:hypothetical protein
VFIRGLEWVVKACQSLWTTGSGARTRDRPRAVPETKEDRIAAVEREPARIDALVAAPARLSRQSWSAVEAARPADHFSSMRP